MTGVQTCALPILKRMMRDQAFIDDMEKEVKAFLDEVAHEVSLMQDRQD